MTRDLLLHHLLDDNLRLAPEYGDGLTNHLPMALHALRELGASDERLHSFYARYAQRFVPIAKHGHEVSSIDWRAHLGDFKAFEAMRVGFGEALHATGRDAVLSSALPTLLPGMAAAAFHGLIRTAHAMQSGHDGELAAALAYWTARWQPLSVPPAGKALPFDEWTARLEREAVGWQSDRPLISLRMQDAASSAPYLALAGRLALEADLLARLAAWAIGVYVRSRNFTVLHMVTGCRALRVLSPWIADGDAATVIAVRALAAAYLASGVARSSVPAEPGASTWPQVIAAAVASDDDHVVKLVHACRDEAAIYGEGAYLQAAVLAVS